MDCLTDIDIYGHTDLYAAQAKLCVYVATAAALMIFFMILLPIVLSICAQILPVIIPTIPTLLVTPLIAGLPAFHLLQLIASGSSCIIGGISGGLGYLLGSRGYKLLNKYADMKEHNKAIESGTKPTTENSFELNRTLFFKHYKPLEVNELTEADLWEKALYQLEFADSLSMSS